MNVSHLNQLLLEASVILLFAVVAVRISTRSGLPSLLIYLGIGVALGQNGIGVTFNNAELTQVIGYAALVVILAEGGLKTSWREIKPVMPAATVLATVGVGVSVFATAAGAHWLVGLDWRTSLLLGAIVSSTDAAAVFSVLRMVPCRTGSPACWRPSPASTTRPWSSSSSPSPPPGSWTPGTS